MLFGLAPAEAMVEKMVTVEQEKEVRRDREEWLKEEAGGGGAKTLKHTNPTPGY